MQEMKVEWVEPGKLIPYEKNAKLHPPEQVEHIANSIKAFGWKQPIVVDGDNVVIIGHGRLLAAKQLGLETVPAVYADDLSPEQVAALRLADNKTNESGWDFSKLEEELAEMDIAGFDMKQFGFGGLQEDGESSYMDKFKDSQNYKGNIFGRYNVPPFSVLDARQGYWQEKKREWLKITGDLSETRDGEYGKFGTSGMTDGINGGTSNFDPVLAETMYLWFCNKGGSILDPFGGEQTKGVVAGELGYRYTACEIRDDQCQLNREKTKEYGGVRYICGDSNKIDELIEERGFDMLFTSPPYYDLEVYSKDDMSALGTYAEFMAQYKNIFERCYKMLHENAFAVVKVGEIRDKKTGQYRCFVADNIKIFEEIGFKFYNDIVLVTPIGTAQLRANNSMLTRKVVKTHQNVLVFYKGDTRNISSHFPQLEFEEQETADAGVEEYVF